MESCVLGGRGREGEAGGAVRVGCRGAFEGEAVDDGGAGAAGVLGGWGEGWGGH